MSSHREREIRERSRERRPPIVSNDDDTEPANHVPVDRYDENEDVYEKTTEKYNKMSTQLEKFYNELVGIVPPNLQNEIQGELKKAISNSDNDVKEFNIVTPIRNVRDGKTRYITGGKKLIGGVPGFYETRLAQRVNGPAIIQIIRILSQTVFACVAAGIVDKILPELSELLIVLGISDVGKALILNFFHLLVGFGKGCINILIGTTGVVVKGVYTISSAFSYAISQTIIALANTRFIGSVGILGLARYTGRLEELRRARENVLDNVARTTVNFSDSLTKTMIQIGNFANSIQTNFISANLRISSIFDGIRAKMTTIVSIPFQMYDYNFEFWCKLVEDYYTKFEMDADIINDLHNRNALYGTMVANSIGINPTMLLDFSTDVSVSAANISKVGVDRSITTFQAAYAAATSRILLAASANAAANRITITTINAQSISNVSILAKFNLDYITQQRHTVMLRDVYNKANELAIYATDFAARLNPSDQDFIQTLTESVRINEAVSKFISLSESNKDYAMRMFYLSSAEIINTLVPNPPIIDVDGNHIITLPAIKNLSEIIIRARPIPLPTQDQIDAALLLLNPPLPPGPPPGQGPGQAQSGPFPPAPGPGGGSRRKRKTRRRKQQRRRTRRF
jgi:hypothetical protein